MLKNFEPCKTKPIDFPAAFRDHICSTLKMPGEWPKVENTFRKMSSLREGFDWQQLTKSEQFKSPIMRTIQDNMEEYIRLCILLSKRFVFAEKQPNVVKGFKADWLLSLSQSKIQSGSIIFEICCFLFNYLVLNFNQAVLFLQEKQGADQYKLALQKIQYVG